MFLLVADVVPGDPGRIGVVLDDTQRFTFAGYEYPHHTDPRLDLDLASYGACKLMQRSSA